MRSRVCGTCCSAPTLAQLKWSDQLEIAPRTVGVVFAIGGFVVAVLGGWLFRMGRALGRSGTKRVLEVDERQAALYLRSFHDDALMLPTIASARRPLFELFSFRGTDPFEEVGGVGAQQLRTGGRRRSARSIAGVARRGARAPLRRDLARSGREPNGRSRDDCRRDRRDQGPGLGARRDRRRGPSRQDVLRVPARRARRHRPALGPHRGVTRRGRPRGRSAARSAVAVHTVRIDADGTARVTYAHRRDEATYRTAVDYALGRGKLDEPALDAAPSSSTSTVGGPT